MVSTPDTLNTNSAHTNKNDTKNMIYRIYPIDFLPDFGVLNGSKSRIIAVQHAYPHQPLPKKTGPNIFAIT